MEPSREGGEHGLRSEKALGKIRFFRKPKGAFNDVIRTAFDFENNDVDVEAHESKEQQWHSAEEQYRHHDAGPARDVQIVKPADDHEDQAQERKYRDQGAEYGCQMDRHI